MCYRTLVNQFSVIFLPAHKVKGLEKGQSELDPLPLKMQCSHNLPTPLPSEILSSLKILNINYFIQYFMFPTYLTITFS